MQLVFLVAGSAPDPYKVTFTQDGGEVITSCSCPAGEMQQACKHRIALLDGDVSGLAPGSLGDPRQIAELIDGTALIVAYQRLQAAEAAVTAAKAAVSREKKALSRVMHGS